MPPQLQSKVVWPMGPLPVVVKGAVTAGITERIVTHRVARRHYLLASFQPFKEGYHPEEYGVPSLIGKDKGKYAGKIFIQKGQRVKVGEPVKVSFFRHVSLEAYEEILYTLYACDEDICPQDTNDPRE